MSESDTKLPEEIAKAIDAYAMSQFKATHAKDSSIAQRARDVLETTIVKFGNERYWEGRAKQIGGVRHE